MIRPKTKRGIFLLFLLAIASWILSRPPSDTNGEPLEKLDTRMNYALWDFNAQLLDDKGRVSLEMESPKLRNNATSAIGTIENPSIVVKYEGDEWHITAESAIITADREHVSLIGDVSMLRHKSLTDEILQINTRDVLLEVAPRTAVTDAAVNIIQAGDQLEAVGMKLDMTNDSFELMDEVRGRYEVP
jgi:LPS export ABC transporter protein LptC